MPTLLSSVVSLVDGEHISIGVSLAMSSDGISRDECLGTEQPVDAHQVLSQQFFRTERIGFTEGTDVVVGLVAKRALQLGTCFVE